MIDTHVHIWDPARVHYAWLEEEGPILNRAYNIQQWVEATEGNGITGALLVQAANNLEDTGLMLEAAESCSLVKGVVGWLPLIEPEKVAMLLEGDFGSNKYIKGIRHLIHNEPDPRWLLQTEVIESLKILANHGLPFDLVGILPEHIETALLVAEKVPGLYMVFDHLNQPPIDTGDKFGEWGELLAEAARHDKFYCKISGLGFPSGKPFKWKAEDVAPYIGFVLQKFGTDRCFCGGDWPVSLLAGEYSYTMDIYKLVLQGLLDKDNMDKVLDRNAEAFYKL